MIIEALKASSPSQKLLSVMSQMVVQSPVVDLICNPANLAKHVHLESPNSQKLATAIFAHCFSQNNNGELQALTSTSILIKTLYSSLYSIATTSQSKEVKQQMREVALALLSIKLHAPFVEQTERNIFNFDQNLKLLALVYDSNQLQANDYVKITSFDQFLKVTSLGLETMTPEV